MISHELDGQRVRAVAAMNWIAQKVEPGTLGTIYFVWVGYGTQPQRVLRGRKSRIGNFLPVVVWGRKRNLRGYCCMITNTSGIELAGR
jgi:hypothetical protein